MISMIISKIFNILIDRPFYRLKLGKCGGFFRIGPSSYINRPKNTFVGESFFSGPNCYMSTSTHASINIGNNVMFGPNVTVLGGNHNIDMNDCPMMLNKHIPERDIGIVIEDDVWVGAGAILLDGTHLSKGTVVAAGAVVNKRTEPNSVYGGVPARLIKYRN